MTETLPADPAAQPVSPAAPGGQPEQDPEWASRCRLRLRAALEVLAEQVEPMSMSPLQQVLATRVPLTPYDASTTKSGGQRAWINLAWLLTTSYEHVGWLHATSAMNDDTRPLPEPPRMLTTSGKRALAAAMIRASDQAVPAALIADMLDATAAAVLRIAGVDDETGRAVCASLWNDA